MEKVGLGQKCCKLEQLELGTGSNVRDQERVPERDICIVELQLFLRT